MIGYYGNLWHGKSWGSVSDGFPVYFTQLPSWNPAQNKPVEAEESPWIVSRESMRMVSQELYNTGMAISIDTGDAIELHPKNKKPIGIRHAYLALGKTYGFPIVHQGPVFSDFKIEGKKTEFFINGFKQPKSRGAFGFFAVAGKILSGIGRTKIEGVRLYLVHQKSAIRWLLLCVGNESF